MASQIVDVHYAIHQSLVHHSRDKVVADALNVVSALDSPAGKQRHCIPLHSHSPDGVICLQAAAVPMRVPPEPTPATKSVTSGSWRRISTPVVR